MGDKSSINLGQSSERYTFSDYILSSESWNEAQGKINNIIKSRKERGNNTILYYDIDDNTLWIEYKFIFLCQFIEFRTAELFCNLNEKKKVNKDFISKLKSKSRANKERRNSDNRILSPASLISDLGFNFGDLIDILNKETDEFDNKNIILKKLKKFNGYRISFVHNSFNTKKKIGYSNLKKIITDGTILGKSILKDYFNSTSSP